MSETPRIYYLGAVSLICIGLMIVGFSLITFSYLDQVNRLAGEAFENNPNIIVDLNRQPTPSDVYLNQLAYPIIGWRPLILIVGPLLGIAMMLIGTLQLRRTLRQPVSH